MGLRDGIEVTTAGALLLLFVESSWGAGCVLSAQRAPYYLIFMRAPWSRNHHYCLFTGEEAETQRHGAAEGVTQHPLESGSVPGAGWLQSVLLSEGTHSSLGHSPVPHPLQRGEIERHGRREKTADPEAKRQPQSETQDQKRAGLHLSRAADR